jgi:hypothetical protein
MGANGIHIHAASLFDGRRRIVGIIYLFLWAIWTRWRRPNRRKKQRAPTRVSIAHRYASIISHQEAKVHGFVTTLCRIRPGRPDSAAPHRIRAGASPTCTAVTSASSGAIEAHASLESEHTISLAIVEAYVRRFLVRLISTKERQALAVALLHNPLEPTRVTRQANPTYRSLTERRDQT